MVSALVFALCTTACASIPPAFEGHFALDPTLAAAAHAEFAPDAPVIVISERRRVKYLKAGRGMGSFEENIYRALLIRRTEGLDHGTVTLPYSRDDISALTAVTRLPDGRTIPFDPATALSVPRYRGAGEEAKTRYATVLPFPEVEPGAIVELGFTIKKEDWSPFASLELDPGLPVKYAELSVLYPNELQLAKRPLPDGWTTSTQMENGLYSSSKSVIQNYLPPRRTAFRPSRERLSMAMLWSSVYGGRILYFQDWALPAGYAWKELGELATLSKAPEITVTQEDARSRIEAIVRWVEDKILDRSSAYDPPTDLRTAQQIADSRLGNANDRALLIVALLRAQKLKPSLVLLDLDGRDIANTPRPLMFDRDVLLVRVSDGREEVWIDPACLACKLGEIHPARQHRPAIVLSAPNQPVELDDYRSGGKLPEKLPKVLVEAVRTPVEKERAVVSEKYSLKLSPRGILVSQGQIEYRGTDAAEIRFGADERAQRKKREAAKKYVDGYADGDVSVSFEGDRAIVKLSDVLLARSGFVQAGPYVVIELSQLFTERWINAASRTRKEPLRFNGRRGFDRTLELMLEPGSKALSLPEPQKIESEEGSYESSVEIKGDRCIIRERLDLVPVDVTPAAHPKLRELLVKVIAARRRPLVLVQK